MKKILNPTRIKKLKKHPIIIAIGLVLIIIGVLQSFVWVYDQFIKNEISESENLERNIFSNIIPGNNYDYVTDYLGPAQKTSDNLYIWNFDSITLGLTFDKETNRIDMMAVYSPQCNFNIEVAKTNFTLCKNKLPEDGGYFPWDIFWSAHHAGYIEQHYWGRSAGYLDIYLGGDDEEILEILKHVEENGDYFDSLDTKRLNPDIPEMTKIAESRKKITPNFIALSSNEIPITKILGYFSEIYNFRFRIH